MAAPQDEDKDRLGTSKRSKGSRVQLSRRAWRTSVAIETSSTVKRISFITVSVKSGLRDGSPGENLLPSINPTFEWIRLAQRIPVRVKLGKLPEGVELRVGTTASVMVMTGTARGMPRALRTPAAIF